MSRNKNWTHIGVKVKTKDLVDALAEQTGKNKSQIVKEAVNQYDADVSVTDMEGVGQEKELTLQAKEPEVNVEDKDKNPTEFNF